MERAASAGSAALPSSAAPDCVTGRRKVIVEQDRSAALLVKVWTEGGAGTFRARASAVDTSGPDSTGEERTVAVAASPGDLLDAVRGWLEEFLAAEA
jgi:hypothetical protein